MVRRCYPVERNGGRWVWVDPPPFFILPLRSQAGCTRATPSCATWSLSRSSSMRWPWEAKGSGALCTSWATTNSGRSGSYPPTPPRPPATCGQSMCMRWSWASPGLRPTQLWALQNGRIGSKPIWKTEPLCAAGKCGQLWKRICRYGAEIQRDWGPQSLHRGASQIPGARQVLSTPTSLPTTSPGCMVVPLRSNISKMQIMTPPYSPPALSYM